MTPQPPDSGNPPNRQFAVPPVYRTNYGLQSLTMSLTDLRPNQLLACQLLAEDELTQAAIAERCDVSTQALWQWRQIPVFAEHVATLRAQIAETIKSEGISLVHNRIKAKHERWRKLGQVIQERAERTPAEHPGASTGLIAVNRHGEGKVDTGLLDAMHQLEESVAEEMGQRQASFSGPTINIVLAQADPGVSRVIAGEILDSE